MIIRAPGQIKPGNTPALFSHVDFLASFPKMAGCELDSTEVLTAEHERSLAR